MFLAADKWGSKVASSRRNVQALTAWVGGSSPASRICVLQSTPIYHQPSRAAATSPMKLLDFLLQAQGLAATSALHSLVDTLCPACALLHGESPSLLAVDCVESESPSLLASDRVESESPSLLAADCVDRESPSLLAVDRVESESPSLLASDCVESESPSLLAFDLVGSEANWLLWTSPIMQSSTSFAVPHHLRGLCAANSL